jgi:hypothetical protein
MRQKFAFIVLFYLFFISSNAQQISILTCGKGQEIYSTFGHSAVRVVDTHSKTDVVYNYGLFDFEDPAFIPKFINGKLDYKVGKESFEDFFGQYVYQQREVKEQVLNLSDSQTKQIIAFLEWNILEANKMYRYDFLYNNCATKIIDLLEQKTHGISLQFFKANPPLSFRALIHQNAKQAVPMIDWGMDLGIGLPADKIASPREYTFLPEFVYKSIQLSKNKWNQKPLVAYERVLLPVSEDQIIENASSPLHLAWFIFGLSIYLRFSKRRWIPYVKSVLFLIFGIGGVVLTYEWFFTEHAITKMNLNLLWLNPLFVLYAFLHNKMRAFSETLRKILLACIILIWPFHLVFGQHFSKPSIWIMFAIFILLIKPKVVFVNNFDLLRSRNKY